MEHVMYLAGLELEPLEDVDWNRYLRTTFSKCHVLYGYTYDHKQDLIVKSDEKHCLIFDEEKGYMINGKAFPDLKIEPSGQELAQQDKFLVLANNWALKWRRNRYESYRADARTHTDW